MDELINLSPLIPIFEKVQCCRNHTQWGDVSFKATNYLVKSLYHHLSISFSIRWTEQNLPWLISSWNNALYWKQPSTKHFSVAEFIDSPRCRLRLRMNWPLLACLTSWRQDYFSGATPSGKLASERWRRTKEQNREFAMNRHIGDETVNFCTKLHGELYNNIIKGEHEKSKCYTVTFRYKRRGFQRCLLDNQRQSGGSVTFCSLFLSKQTITSLHLF